MGCTTHVLGFAWTHHDWHRSLLGTESAVFPERDMWGRPINIEHVTCHTQDVCGRCGATRAGTYCGCDKARAERCAFRLAGLRALAATR